MPSDRHSADESLALALARGQTIQDAARAAGVSESTVSRRLRNPRFRRRVQELRTEIIKLAVGRLASHMTEATEMLAALMRMPVKPGAQVALQAARSILGLGGALWKDVEHGSDIRRDRLQLRRLAELVDTLREEHPDWFKAEVHPDGDDRDPG